MFDQTNQPLTQVYEYLKAGKRDQARVLLEPIVRAEPDNVDAWWLMAMAVTTPDEMRNALQNVVRIKPDYLNARQMLDAMPGPAGASGQSMVPVSPRVPTPPAPPAGTQIGESADDLFHEFDTPAPLPSSPSLPFAKAPTPSTGPSTGSIPSYPAPAAAQPRKMNPLVWVLIGMVGLLVCICGACVLIFGSGFVALLRDPTVQAVVSTGITRVEAPNRLPSDAQSQGPITAGRSQIARLDPLEQHTWRYQGRSGERVTVTVNAQGATLNVFVGIYDSGGALVARADAARTNRNQALSATLPDDGTYTILVGGLGGSFGSYEIQVTSSASSQ